jgi:multicomponent Na+:H+ antiporter subunit A
MAPDAIVLLAAIALPFAGAVAVPLVFRALGERTAYVCAALAAASFGLIATQFDATGSVVAVEWVPSMGIALELYVDGLSLLVAGLASGVGVLIFTYSGGYMPGEPGQPKYYASLLVFMGAMIGLVLAADLISLFLFWELTSLSSFALIGHYQRADASLYAARKSMLITVVGGLFLLVGLVVLHLVSGAALDGTATFSLTEMINNADAMTETLREQGLLVPTLALVGIGAGAKSAQVPLHVWLPNAMEAPTPVSAFLHSATMVKAGVYLLGRVRPLLLTGEWETIFVALGLATMTVTAVLAVAASDVKELLAYSTASHLGLIVAGFGFRAFESVDLGAETGGFHILNHAMFKAALFLVAGIIAHEAGTRAIDDLGGLRKDLPIAAAITVVAALGMAGVPPFNGFYSKEFLFEAAWELGHTAGGLYWLVPAVAVLGSVFTFLYSIRFLMLFFGDRPDGLGHVHSPPWSMRGPPLLLAGVAGVIGLGGLLATVGIHLEPIEAFLGRVVQSVGPAGEFHPLEYKIPLSPKPAVLMSVATIGLGVVAYPFFGRLRDGIRRVLAVGPTTVDFYYDGAVDGLESLSAAVLDRVETGMLRTYAAWAVGAFAVLALAGYVAAGVGLPDLLAAAPAVTLPVALVLVLAVASAVAVAAAPSHIAGVLTLSIVGFMIAIFFILASAPDLALTQLVIETLVLVIFLLVLNRLPAFYGEMRRSRAIRDGVLSAVVGATVFLTVVVATSQGPAQTLRSRLVRSAGLPTGEHANELLIDWGGGANIVNVILVDFRAFDTLGEISVVAMAALSVLTLIGLRNRGESQ